MKQYTCIMFPFRTFADLFKIVEDTFNYHRKGYNDCTTIYKEKNEKKIHLIQV